MSIILIKCFSEIKLMKPSIKLSLSFLIILSFLTSPQINSVNSAISEKNTLNSNLEPDAVKLVVATRHDSTIWQKYRDYFAKSPLGASVGITSPNQIEFLQPSTYYGVATALNNSFVGASVAWGGGPTLFNNLIQDDLLRSIDDPELLAWINSNVSDVIAGAEMKKYDNNELKWVSAAISSFGFTVNNKTLEERNLPFPTTWEDLASPDFFTKSSENNIAMGNAPDTTSNTRIYQIILQKFGWERGWEIIYSMAGNSKIYDGSVTTRSAVETGDVAVSMTIDFYGVIAMAENPDCQYVIPDGGSIVNGDPIAIAKNAPDLDAARAFVKYVLSEEGQALWLDNRINRLPVRQDAFQTAMTLNGSDSNIVPEQVLVVENLYNKTMENEGILFDEDLALSLEETMRYHFEATITSVHNKLRDAWTSIVNNYKNQAWDPYNDERFDQIIDIYGAPIITQLEAQTIEAEDTYLDEIGNWEEQSIIKYNEVFDIVDDPFVITSVVTSNTTQVTNTTTVITSTDTDGNTTVITSEFETTITSAVTSLITEVNSASSIINNVEDVSLNVLMIYLALFIPIIFRYKISKPKQS